MGTRWLRKQTGSVTLQNRSCDEAYEPTAMPHGDKEGRGGNWGLRASEEMFFAAQKCEGPGVTADSASATLLLEALRVYTQGDSDL